MSYLYLSPVLICGSFLHRNMVGSRRQPLSESMSILARTQHFWPCGLPFFISSHMARFFSTAENEEENVKSMVKPYMVPISETDKSFGFINDFSMVLISFLSIHLKNVAFSVYVLYSISQANCRLISCTVIISQGI